MSKALIAYWSGTRQHRVGVGTRKRAGEAKNNEFADYDVITSSQRRWRGGSRHVRQKIGHFLRR
jgi:hypothetical protein